MAYLILSTLQLLVSIRVNINIHVNYSKEENKEYIDQISQMTKQILITIHLFTKLIICFLGYIFRMVFSITVYG